MEAKLQSVWKCRVLAFGDGINNKSSFDSSEEEIISSPTRLLSLKLDWRSRSTD